jgi:hypothetical protein
MSQSLILIDILSSACWEKKRKGGKKKREKQSGAFFPQGWTSLDGCAMWDFCGY